MSAADPKRSFLQFVDQQHFPDEFVTGDSAISAYAARRARSTSRSANCRTSPRCRARARCIAARCRSARASITSSAPTTTPSTGNFSHQPYIDMIFPSMIDRDMAPPGHHVMSCFVQYAPYDVEGGWDDAKTDAFGETVISTIEQYAPNIRQSDRRHAGDHAARTSSGSPASPAATSSTANCCCTSCSSCARRRNGPISAPRCRATTSAPPARIPVAA